MTCKRVIKMMVISAFLSSLSGFIPQKVIDVVPGSEDCANGCVAAAAGWPVAYIVDGHGLSPHGSADLVGVLLGFDRLDYPQAVLNWLIWFFLVAVMLAPLKRWRDRRR